MRGAGKFNIISQIVQGLGRMAPKVCVRMYWLDAYLCKKVNTSECMYRLDDKAFLFRPHPRRCQRRWVLMFLTLPERIEQLSI